MNKFLVLASALVCVSARPDIGLKLREGAPSGSYLPGVGAQSTYEESLSHFQSKPTGNRPTYHTYPVVGAALHKSFFFDATEDIGPTHVRVHVQPSEAAGDKSIFIKAPAYSSKIIPHFNVPPQQQAGKTKVVVLVKKPEEVQDLVVPAAAQAPAAQPEVTFVTYKSQKEAEEKIEDIQQGASSGSSAKAVYNHRELVANIKDEPQHIHQETISYAAPVAQPILGGGPIFTGPSPAPIFTGSSAAPSILVGPSVAPHLLVGPSASPHVVVSPSSFVSSTASPIRSSTGATIDISIGGGLSQSPEPEVFFVKYNDQKDAADKIHSIQNGSPISSVSDEATNLHNANDLINAIPGSNTVTASSIIKETSFGPAGESGPY